jgi:hypothetical protein
LYFGRQRIKWNPLHDRNGGGSSLTPVLECDEKQPLAALNSQPMWMQVLKMTLEDPLGPAVTLAQLISTNTVEAPL